MPPVHRCVFRKVLTSVLANSDGNSLTKDAGFAARPGRLSPG